MKKWLLAGLVVFALHPVCLGGDAPSLETVLAPLAKAHQGKVAIAVKHLGTGESYALNADEVMPTASLIKFPVMVETYYQFHEGKCRPDDMIVLSKEDKVPGSGILTYHFSPGLALCLKDAVHLMIVYSDNTATNLVLDHIGIPSTNVRMEGLGLPNTKINAKVFKPKTRLSQERGEKYGLGSTTANEMIRLLELLHGDKLVGPAECKEMLGHMKACDDKDKFPRFLPPGTAVAFKTGSVDAAKTAAGIIYVPMPGSDPKAKQTQPVAVCVLTNDNADKRWVTDNAGNVLCAKVAKAVYDYYAEKK
ncbi:MAG TPA: serine hydrolase [Gemmataceae bacterium]|jgi:beta-lactamase class A